MRTQPDVSRLLQIQRSLAAIGNVVESTILVVASGLLVFLVVALFLQVVSRYVIKEPIPWTEEGGRFVMVWYAMLAAALAARKGQQFVFRWATLPLSPVVRTWLRQIVNLLTIGFLTVILVQSVAYLDIVANQTAAATGVNMRIPYLGVAAGFGFLLVVYVLDLLDGICSVVTKQTFSQRERLEFQMYGALSSDAPANEDLVEISRSS